MTPLASFLPLTPRLEWSACMGPEPGPIGMSGEVPEDITYADGARAWRQRADRDALLIFEKLAAQGDARAVFALGRIYATGRLPPDPDALPGEPGYRPGPDFETSRQLYRRAAAAGSKVAAAALAADALSGRAPPEGNPGPPDIEAAESWLARAGEIGQALYLRGDMTMMRGEPEAAAALYRRASEAGNRIARIRLARMRCYGNGIEADLDAALAWWIRAHPDSLGDSFTWDLFTCPPYQELAGAAAMKRRQAVIRRLQGSGELATLRAEMTPFPLSESGAAERVPLPASETGADPHPAAGGGCPAGCPASPVKTE